MILQKSIVSETFKDFRSSNNGEKHSRIAHSHSALRDTRARETNELFKEPMLNLMANNAALKLLTRWKNGKLERKMFVPFFFFFETGSYGGIGSIVPKTSTVRPFWGEEECSWLNGIFATKRLEVGGGKGGNNWMLC